MNRAERLYRIDALLKAKPHSLQQLQDALESSRATVVRDLSYLKDFMQAPIEYHRTDNVYRYAADAGRFELPGFWLNESELCALLATGQMLDQMQPGLLAPYIGPLRRRIRDLLAQSGHSARAVADSILLQPMATRTTHPERFGTIAGALLEGRALLIRYRARIRDEVTERVIHPQRLIRYRDNWYLAAYCERAQGLRIFSLDRIDRAEHHAAPRPEVERKALERFLGGSFGIFSGSATAWAVLRFSAEASRWVADEVWHPDQIGLWAGARYELQVPYSDPRELLRDILKFGPDVEVVAPSELRTLVAERLRSAASVYADDSPLR
ncbi:YafY family protein [Thiohalocapsa sp. ML1]|jgi:predicted DNA-binding transcriptional regulator YafY|uniref:helix-turn-helix transcriptional regulator n=1 Tax=Thiohalocapsa sp. ML1 TaxID=1431688 RepID=UPI000731EEBD|nr:WYL domain-containing protein [Thiohalocapsa sp. ML1]